MTPTRILCWLLPVVAIGLLLAGGLMLKQNFTDTLARIAADGKEFRQSPGCYPNASYVNQALPPCQDSPATLTAKERQTEHSQRMAQDYNTNSLEVRDGSGNNRHFTEVGKDLWDSVKVGDQITVTAWKGRVIRLSFNGSSSSVEEGNHPASLWGGSTGVWLGVFLVGFGGLALWNILGRLRTPSAFGGG